MIIIYIYSSDHYNHLGVELDVEFGTGALKGEINSDTIWFSDLQIDHQDISEILTENGAIFRDMDFDGILGLAYPSMAA
jgi:cathepsin D